ncbi:unnamed protein product [Moneuplotes crassus]|uniref:Uncharacterized protein n=1 Tax=Euplotes crassus TaxID=5936 RepID=A0AAD2D146_EUPCR|nr:unnamed protein product [Moneuplotes crassus]CAI2377030.1 unnamed protein product [Moneuplotes crassus]
MEETSSQDKPQDEREHKEETENEEPEPTTMIQELNAQPSIRSGHANSIAYTEMTEKQAVKESRKKIENDIQLLKNRVRMLQKEKAKADKKILQTKTKAEEILKRTSHNNKLYQDKIKQREKQKKAEIARKKKLTEERKQRDQRIKKRKEEIHEIKMEEVKNWRHKEKHKMTKQKRDEDKYTKSIRARQAAEIKLSEEKAIENKRLRQEELAQANRIQTQMKIEEEAMKIDSLEKEAQSLEEIEQELLNKLQNTQMMEKDAFAELEKAMIASSENRRQRFEKNS